jgi:hypothetical protein
MDLDSPEEAFVRRAFGHRRRVGAIEADCRPTHFSIERADPKSTDPRRGRPTITRREFYEDRGARISILAGRRTFEAGYVEAD